MEQFTSLLYTLSIGSQSTYYKSHLQFLTLGRRLGRYVGSQFLESIPVPERVQVFPDIGVIFKVSRRLSAHGKESRVLGVLGLQHQARHTEGSSPDDFVDR